MTYFRLSAAGLIVFIIWLLALFALICGGPPEAAGQEQQLLQLLRLDWAGISPWKVVLFNLLGIWPMTMAIFLWPERQKLPYWPFGGLSFVLGMYALLPYFIFRGSPSLRKEDAVARWLQKKSTSAVLLLVSLGLFFYGLAFGDVALFWQELQSEHFVFAMSLDAFLFHVFALLLMRQDAARLDWRPRGQLLSFCYLVPLFGVLLYLLLRPAQEQSIAS
jgi:hypothetical protein